MMGYRQRIEKAVIEMFNLDREKRRFIDILEGLRDDNGNWVIELNLRGLSDIAMDLLGVPQDNTVETNACDIVQTTGEWPEGTFCRDCYDDMWITAKTGEEFINYCYKSIKEYIEIKETENGQK